VCVCVCAGLDYNSSGIESQDQRSRSKFNVQVYGRGNTVRRSVWPRYSIEYSFSVRLAVAQSCLRAVSYLRRCSLLKHSSHSAHRSPQLTLINNINLTFPTAGSRAITHNSESAVLSQGRETIPIISCKLFDSKQCSVDKHKTCMAEVRQANMQKRRHASCYSIDVWQTSDFVCLRLNSCNTTTTSTTILLYMSVEWQPCAVDDFVNSAAPFTVNNDRDIQGT